MIMRKKVIFRIAVLAAALLFSYNAHAQLILGGNIGLSVAGDNRVGINIAPEVGYAINPYFTMGGLISYQSLYNTFGITPYVRTTPVSIKDIVRLHLSLTAPMRFAGSYQSYQLDVRPGISVRISGNVWIMAHIGAFGYEWVHNGAASSSGWIARVNGDTINIGFCIGL